MSFRIELSSNFEKQLKKLLKKYPSIKSDVFELGKQLSKNPLTGTLGYPIIIRTHFYN